MFGELKNQLTNEPLWVHLVTFVDTELQMEKHISTVSSYVSG